MAESALGIAGFHATGMVTAGGNATAGWGITTTALGSANLNMAGTVFGGGGLDQMWKSGTAGLATGAFTATGGLGLANDGLLGKLAFQGLGSAGRSVGQNWVMGRSLFSRVQVGLGPVNLTLGAGQRLIQLQNNIGNAFFNSLGMLNTATQMLKWKEFIKDPSAYIQWSSQDLTLAYSDGWLGKLWGKTFRNTGAYTIISTAALSIGSSNLYSHEARHIWQSRVLGDSFLLNYFLHGAYPGIMGVSQYYGNYYEHSAQNGW